MIKIKGLQKLTLLDYPNITACTVFLHGCNFRCPFCHNRDLVVGNKCEDIISENDFFDFLKKRRGVLEGVCVTGGEPLLSEGLSEFISKIKACGYKVKLDTNGYATERLGELLRSGNIDYVAMDIKNSPSKYARTVGLEKIDISRIFESIALIASLAPEYEFRTTVTEELHTVEDIIEISKMIESLDYSGYYIQPYRDSDGVIAAGLHAPDRATLEKMISVSGGTLRGMI